MTGAAGAAPGPAPARVLWAVILAAGEGTRMRSPLPKVLHPVAGLPMVVWVVRVARAAGAERPVVVVGFGRDRVAEALAGEPVAFAVQEEQLGTGHAVLCADRALGQGDGDVLVLSGDVPLIRGTTLRAFVADHRRERRAVTVMTAILEDPGMLGRVVRDEAGGLVRIVEQRDATAAEREIREINGGIYCFTLADLRAALPLLGRDNDQRQYYLTDTMEILRRRGGRVGAWTAADPREILGVNTPQELALADRIMRERGDGCA